MMKVSAHINELITLIQRNEDEKPLMDNSIKNATYEKTCSYEEFIIMLQKIVSSTLLDCKLIPEDETFNELFPNKKLDQSVISFKVVRRTPYKELKPTMRHEVLEEATKANEERIGTLYGQRMEYILQFNVFCSGYAKSESVMNNFEEAIFNYTSYLKKNGVIECLFKQQITDSDYEHFRKMCSVRHLQYEIILEKQWIDFESVLDTVQVDSELL